jgi:CBS domain-containing protein
VNPDLRSSVRSTPWDEPISVSPATTVRQVAVLLDRYRIGAVVVRADDDRDVGIVSERDVVALVAAGGDADTTPAGSLATQGMITVDVAASLGDVVDAMAGHQVRHVGVTDGDEVVGMLSARDVLRVLSSDRDDGGARLPSGS